MKKNIKKIILITILMIILFSLKVYANNESNDVVQQGIDDINVIPDKYNTGVDKNITLTTVNPGDTYQGVHCKESGTGEGSKTVIDFYYDSINSKIQDEIITIENADFSQHMLVFHNSGMLKNNKKIIFNNCKFSSIGTGVAVTKLTFEINNCTIETLHGSNFTANNCYIAGVPADGIIPFQNVEINNCYIVDRSYSSPSGVHIDGTQIYGNKNVEAKNIHFNNCRFEIPSLYIDDKTNTSYVNACIMLQLEFNNGSDIIFDNCIINGGGYSVYAESKYPDTYEITNSAIKNLRIGSCRKWGGIYYRKSAGVRFENVVDTHSLYISSVWKDSKGQHFLVTNDTSVDRKLTVYTDKGEYNFTIPKMLSLTEINEQKITNINQLSIDIEKVIDADCKWMVFCDTTESMYPNQIRYVNYSGEKVLKSKTIYKNTSYVNYDEAIIEEGKCGNNITYKLKGDGTLTLSGTGSTYHYNSGTLAPWVKYKSLIKKVIIEEGITVLGSQLFRTSEYIEEIELPITLTKISGYSITSVLLENVNYSGTQEQWDLIVIDKNNTISNANINLKQKDIDDNIKASNKNDIIVDEDKEDIINDNNIKKEESNVITNIVDTKNEQKVKEQKQEQQENKKQQETQNLTNNMKEIDMEDRTLAIFPIPQAGKKTYIQIVIIIMIISICISYIIYKKRSKSIK